nr:hypothetical protein BaRGS_018816 [Batillaria attramentaria]
MAGPAEVSSCDRVTQRGDGASLVTSKVADGAQAQRKPLRRQKSLAEFFGVVLYKSKVQLQELFSRRDRESLAAPGSGGATYISTEMTASSAGESVLTKRPVKQSSGIALGSQPDLLAGTSSQKRRHTPESLFCVAHTDTSGGERLLSSRSVDALHRDRRRDSEGCCVAPRAKEFLTPGRTNKSVTSATLVKSSSDSLCRLTLPTTADSVSLVKASSDNSCFVHSTNRMPLTNTPARLDRQGVLDSSSDQPDDDIGPTVSYVLDYLLVGSVEAVYNEPLLCRLEVDAIIDITNVAPHRVPADKKTICPCTCVRKQHFRSKLNLAVDDIEWENIEQYFADINAFISGCRRRGKRVLVVSYHGRSRAPAAVVQYLMHFYRIPLARALDHVRSCRPQARINPGFQRALERLQVRLAEEDTGQLSQLGPLPQLALPRPRTAWDEC